MVDQFKDADVPKPVTDDMADAGVRVDRERQALSETVGEARDAVVAEARDIGDEAASRLAEGAEGARDEAAAGLTAFSDALKAASSELSGKQLGFAGDMVQQAAGGLESFVRAVEGRSPGEMLDGLRSFGRQNPVGFIAGSVLAGFALGRVAAVLPAEAGSTPSPAAPAGRREQDDADRRLRRRRRASDQVEGAGAMTPDRDDRSLASLVSDLVQQLSTLVQTEGKLLRSEVRESGKKITAGAIEIVAGAGLLIAALVILLQALVQALAAAGLGEAWASLLVGLVVALVGYLVVQRGTKNLSPDELALSRSTEQLRKDANLVKEQTQ